MNDYDEPRIVFTVRELLRDMRDEIQRDIAALSVKLDDRVTKGAFNAIRTDVDAALDRIRLLEDAVTETKGVNVTKSRVVGVVAWLVLTGLAALDLFLRVHGG